MKRSLFLGLLGGSMAQAAIRTPGDVSEDKAICDFAAQVLGKLHAGDFSYVATRTHPPGLQMFRDYLDVIYKRLAKRYGDARVVEVSGLEKPPKDIAVKNDAFMVRCLNFLNQKHPEILASPVNATLVIVGGIVECQSNITMAHVMYRYNRAHIDDVEMKAGNRVEFVAPSQMTLLRTSDECMLRSVMGLSAVARWWHRDLDPDAALLEHSL